MSVITGENKAEKIEADNPHDKNNILQSIFRAAPVGIGMVVDRVIVEANNKLCEMTDYSMDEIIGKSARMLYPSDEDFNYVGIDKYEQIKEKGNGHVETRWMKKNGEIIDIFLSSSAIDINDISRGVTFTALDISELKTFEQTIRMRDIQLNNIAENVPAALFQYFVRNNGDTGFYYISESSEQIFGLKNNLDGFFELFTSHVVPEFREQFLKSIEKSVTGKKTWEYEGVFQKDSGEFIWFRCTSNPVIMDDEVIYNGIGMDINDKIKFLSLSERATKLESLALLAGGIAHDFNNILGGIFGYIEMARNYSSADKTVSGYLDSAMQIFDRSKALTGQLLTFAKGGEPVKKNGSISQTLIDLTTFLMKDSGHAYEFNLPDDLKICTYDHEQISNALENIITNAIQAMPAGGSLYVSAENTHVPEKKDTYLRPGDYVKISIKDSGTGIPGEMLPKIFDPFFTTKNKCKGMGLATSHSIITKHHGCIDVNSSPGKGTAFYIFLPASEGEAEVKPVKKEDEHTGNGSILLMDDEVFIRETVGEMLKIMGYKVYKATDGGEAIKMVKEGLTNGVSFKAFILDLNIPNGIGGKETISRLRQMGIEAPAFASSGYSDDPVIASPADFGFTDSLRKPYRMEDLALMLNYYLKNNHN
ncbi:MAG: hypothetical protein CVV49_17275 [Spirochaetae bacterium HGW-Spirochaetae-5]|nr:MAG: hypothetical protein CVV49_17275 [Spirochaetae bacterium HGW-Spirochaetae-5]